MAAAIDLEVLAEKLRGSSLLVIKEAVGVFGPGVYFEIDAKFYHIYYGGLTISLWTGLKKVFFCILYII